MSELQRLAGDVAELQDDMSQAKETLVVHDTRLGNGRAAMENIRRDVEELQPKAPDWLKIFLAGLAVVGVLMGGQLWLTDRLNARPTQAEIKEMTAPIKAAQRETAREIKEIEKSQSAQAISIKNIEEEQSDQGRKLDDILLRLPIRRRDR